MRIARDHGLHAEDVVGIAVPFDINGGLRPGRRAIMGVPIGRTARCRAKADDGIDTQTSRVNSQIWNKNAYVAVVMTALLSAILQL